MNFVNIHEAKTHFSKLISRVLEGQEIIVAKGGKPMVRIIPYFEEPSIRRGGQFKGIIKIGKNFDDPLPEEYLKHFYGEDNTEGDEKS